MATERQSPPDYDWLSLEEEEAVLWADTPHPYSIAPALLVGIPLSFLLVGLFIIAAAYLNYTNTNYVVTTAALYKKTGVLSRSVQRIEFDKVQDTAYQQGFLGAQFGYGTVNVSTAGGSGVEMSFQSVAEPQRLQSLVNERIRERDGSTGAGDEKAAVLDDILTELRAIRTAVEGGDGPTTAAGGGAGDESDAGGGPAERNAALDTETELNDVEDRETELNEVGDEPGPDADGAGPADSR
jgi:membrane protein YdbS with pleckstrin-like domain